MLDHLKLFFFSIVGTMVPNIFRDKETTETKKCMHCLRRIKVYHYKCPHCRTYNFDFDSN